MANIRDKLKNDRMLLAAFAGFFAALGADLSLYLMNLLLPGQNINMPQVTLEFFLNASASLSLPIRILGVIWSTIVGGVYALLYLIALDLTGWNNLWLKALLVVNGAWLLFAGFIISLLNLITFTRNEPWSIVAFYIAHLLFATYLNFLVDKYGQEPSKAGNTEFFAKPTRKYLDQGDARSINTIKPKKLRKRNP